MLCSFKCFKLFCNIYNAIVLRLHNFADPSRRGSSQGVGDNKPHDERTSNGVGDLKVLFR